jgi:Fe-S cluster biogenesis protein NfuA
VTSLARAGGQAGFGGGADEEESPLAATVFNALAGARQAGGGGVRVAELLLAEDFAVVLLAEGDWDGPAVAAPPLWIADPRQTLDDQVGALMAAHLANGHPVLSAATARRRRAQEEEVVAARARAEGTVEDEILELLESHVRPTVRADGGDVVFERFDPATGIVRPPRPAAPRRAAPRVTGRRAQVWVRLVGACVGCASSTVTVRFMISNLLVHQIAEVNEVRNSDDDDDDADDAPRDDGSNWTG